jgi:hypothetical protein
MNTTTPRSRLSWSALLLISLALIIAGAAAATWGLARYDRAARLLGVVPTSVAAPLPQAVVSAPQSLEAAAPDLARAAADAVRIAQLEGRLARVENATRKAEGSAGRADALVVAFAARRAIDRGVALGYLEPILIDRFAPHHTRAVATIVTASRTPVRLDELIAEYEDLGPELRRGGLEDSWWTGFKRELGSLVEIHPADRPPAKPDARYRRALSRLSSGDVDGALAETMRMPGASRAGAWVDKARRYVGVHRALDEIESSALLVNN